MSDWQLRPAGEGGLLVEVGEGGDARWLAEWLRASDLDLDDVVPGGSTVLIRARSGIEDAARAVRELAAVDHTPMPLGRTHVIAVRYDGEDLDSVCAALGISRERFVVEHTGAVHSVAYFGFTPGFPYIDGVPEILRVPRRDSPRERVAIGSVAVANGYTIIYPGGTPGGWNIVGHADIEPWWDIERDPPNSVDIGDRITFRSQP